MGPQGPPWETRDPHGTPGTLGCLNCHVQPMVTEKDGCSKQRALVRGGHLCIGLYQTENTMQTQILINFHVKNKIRYYRAHYIPLKERYNSLKIE